MSQHRFAGVVATVYFLDRGEGIPRHKHPFEHTTACSRGRSRVQIEGMKPFEMVPGMSDYVLPAERYHEVQAIEDGTVVVHMLDGANTSDPAADPNWGRPGYVPGRGGGVLLDNGAIVYPEDEK